jgi:hypothetical protein
VVRAAPGDHARWVELGKLGWGFDEQTAYLDLAEAQLRTRVPGFEELTALPTVPRANTNLPTMGAAEYIASTLTGA